VAAVVVDDEDLCNKNLGSSFSLTEFTEATIFTICVENGKLTTSLDLGLLGPPVVANSWIKSRKIGYYTLKGNKKCTVQLTKIVKSIGVSRFRVTSCLHFWQLHANSWCKQYRISLASNTQDNCQDVSACCWEMFRQQLYSVLVGQPELPVRVKSMPLSTWRHQECTGAQASAVARFPVIALWLAINATNSRKKTNNKNIGNKCQLSSKLIVTLHFHSPSLLFRCKDCNWKY